LTLVVEQRPPRDQVAALGGDVREFTLCATVDGAITMLRGAQAAFLLDGTLLEIDVDAFAADHEAHAGAHATDTTATLAAQLPEPHLAAAGALASATRAKR
jgi:hypothetical protein